MAYIFIEPKDSLFFRKGKSMNKGEDSWADTFLLPNPSVIWGAICSMLLAHNQKSYEAADSLQLIIKGIYLKNKSSIYLPAPADLFVSSSQKANNSSNVIVGKYVENLSISNYVFPFRLQAPKTSMEKLDSHYISLFSLKSYAEQESKSLKNVVKISDLVKSDYKISIKVDSKLKQVADGQLFRLDTSAFMDNVGVLVDIEVSNEAQIPNTGILKLGGESKLAQFSTLDNILPHDLDFESIKQVMTYKSTVFKIYMQTAWLCKIDCFYSDLLAALNIQVLASVIERVMPIGGFDVVANKPKPMLNAIPAGSVLLVKTDKEMTGNELLDKLRTTFFQEKGFGLVYIFPQN